MERKDCPETKLNLQYADKGNPYHKPAKEEEDGNEVQQQEAIQYDRPKIFG